MEEISQLPNITPLDLEYAQRCRLLLGITTLTDIMMINGIVIGVGLYARAIPYTSPRLLPRK